MRSQNCIAACANKMIRDRLQKDSQLCVDFRYYLADERSFLKNGPSSLGVSGYKETHRITKQIKMKNIKRTALIFGLLLFGWNQANAKIIEVAKIKESSIKTPNSENDKEQIQKLIRQVLMWANSNPINLLPVSTDRKNKFIIGVNIDRHKQNISKLKATNYFSIGFIDNYNKIVSTLGKGIKDGRYGKLLVGDLPIFGFATNTDPWCGCQDVPFDKPNPWEFIKMNIVSLDNSKAEADWKWGKLELNTDPSWKNFAYRFRAVKESGKWKIAYLEGFDFVRATRKN